MDNQRARLGQIALMMMTFSAVYTFPSIINNSIQIGLATIPAIYLVLFFISYHLF